MLIDCETARLLDGPTVPSVGWVVDRLFGGWFFGAVVVAVVVVAVVVVAVVVGRLGC